MFSDVNWQMFTFQISVLMHLFCVNIYVQVEKSIFANNFQIKKEICKSHWGKYEGIVQRNAYERNIVDYYPKKIADKVELDDDKEQAMYILADLNDNR